MQKILNDFPEYKLILQQKLGPDEHAVLLGSSAGYSACIMRPRHQIAMSPNYQANGHGLLTGPLTRVGLADLLQWTDRNVAAARYRLLARLPANVIAISIDRREPR